MFYLCSQPFFLSTIITETQMISLELLPQYYVNAFALILPFTSVFLMLKILGCSQELQI